MGNLLVSLRIVFLIAMRNLTSHRVKSLIVGSIMAFGTMLMVVGTSLLDSVEESMEKVVSSSLTGQLQIYSTQGRDELSLFGGLTASRPDIGEIEDFSKLKQLVEPIENTGFGRAKMYVGRISTEGFTEEGEAARVLQETVKAYLHTAGVR